MLLPFNAFTTATIEPSSAIHKVFGPVQTQVEVVGGGSERKPPSWSSLVAELLRDGGSNGGHKKVAT